VAETLTINHKLRVLCLMVGKLAGRGASAVQYAQHVEQPYAGLADLTTRVRSTPVLS
jgi:hypothetical protein